MKIRALAALFIIGILSISGQNREIRYDYNAEKEYRDTEERYTLSPYAMFGDSTKTLTTKHERDKDHTLKIPIKNGLFETNMRTGLVTIKDNQGAIFYTQQLTNEEKARFVTIDPHAENYYSWSPYAYCANNPLKYIDPTGMDWYTDKEGMMQYDPNINEKSKLKDGEKYIGPTHQKQNKKGSIIEDYRKDGSIMYAKESSAYKRMVARSEQTGKESMAALTDKGTLVLPDYKNKNSTNSNDVNLADYNYSIKNGNIVDGSGTEFNTYATAHTHLDGSAPSTWVGPNDYGDLGFATFSTPYKPVYVLQLNGKNTVSIIVAAPNPSRKVSNFRYDVHSITGGHPDANITNLMNGSFKLIPYTKSINFKSGF